MIQWGFPHPLLPDHIQRVEGNGKSNLQVMHRKGVKTHTPQYQGSPQSSGWVYGEGQAEVWESRAQGEERRAQEHHTGTSAALAMQTSLGILALAQAEWGDVLTELQQKLGQEGQRWWHHELDSHSARPLRDPTQERVNSSDTLLSGGVTGTGKNNSRP